MLCVQFLFWYIAHKRNYGILAAPARTLFKTRLNCLTAADNKTPLRNNVCTNVNVRTLMQIILNRRKDGMKGRKMAERKEEKNFELDKPFH